MIRAAAKNHAYAAVVVKPESYDAILEELRDAGGTLSMPTRESLAAEAFAYTARYDTAIARWFAEKSEDFPPLFMRAFEKVVDLPYGENPHQRAAYYAQVGARMHVLSQVKQHHGKQISYNNLLDLDSARTHGARLRGPGVRDRQAQQPVRRRARRDARCEAYEQAFACDPISAYGGVIALNRPVDQATAERSHQQFIEVLFAPGYDDDALEVLDPEAEHPHPRGPGAPPARARRARDPPGHRRPARPGPRQRRATSATTWRSSPTAARPSRSGPTCCSPGASSRHVKSNAIVLARDLATIGIGAGQMSRVDSVRLAVEKSQAETLQGRRAGLRRVLPVRRRPRAGDRGGRHRGHPARRLGARRRGRRRRRGGRRRDGLHPAPPLPALVARRSSATAPSRPARTRRPSATRASSAPASTSGSPGCTLGRRARRRRRASRRASRWRSRSRNVVAALERVGASAQRRRPHPHVHHRHLALGGDRPRPRRGLRRRSGRSPRCTRSAASSTRACWSRSRPTPSCETAADSRSEQGLRLPSGASRNLRRRVSATKTTRPTRIAGVAGLRARGDEHVGVGPLPDLRGAGRGEDPPVHRARQPPAEGEGRRPRRVVCPTTPLTRQWALAAGRLGLHLAPDAAELRPAARLPRRRRHLRQDRDRSPPSGARSARAGRSSSPTRPTTSARSWPGARASRSRSATPRAGCCSPARRFAPTPRRSRASATTPTASRSPTSPTPTPTRSATASAARSRSSRTTARCSGARATTSSRPGSTRS